MLVKALREQSVLTREASVVPSYKILCNNGGGAFIHSDEPSKVEDRDKYLSSNYNNLITYHNGAMSMQRPKPEFTAILDALEVAYSYNNVNKQIVSRGDGSLYVAYREEKVEVGNEESKFYKWCLVNANDSTGRPIQIQDFVDRQPDVIGIYAFTVIGHAMDRKDEIDGMTAKEFWHKHDLPDFTLPYNQEHETNRAET